MSIRRKLERLTGETGSREKAPDRSQEIGALRRRIDIIMRRRPEVAAPLRSGFDGERVDLGDVVRGDEVENDHGRFFLVHDEIPSSSRHGSRRIEEISSLDMRRAALIANEDEIAGFHCTDGLFLDTETTGLSGGTGTIAFLIGIGWFDGNAFVTEQLFARDFSEERAALAYLSDLARRKRFLITFNGKSFDVGLLSSRFIMNRLPDPLSVLPHLDLLHPSRRLLGHRLENSRLGTIEQEVLGFRREGDIPGSEIPQRYFDWLRRRDGRLVGDIFEHNRLDVISMATLTVHLTGLLGYEPVRDDCLHEDALAVARLLLDRGCEDEAQGFLSSLFCSKNRGVADEAGRILSLICKRKGNWTESVRIWEEMITGNACHLFAVEELAKWCEHREGDFDRALNLVQTVLENGHYLSITERNSFTYRLDRLKRRVGK
ncbi:MAG TPA: ribonuclease H-like domain-containing protein [Syntrophales bacterium]|nr:ribonuclease H-like domain-containing protein [Syntrophales bacterium]